ncbi:1-deoxy-D-xylulose-5-phosphate synthase N-terminal domain-containing protein [Erysipelothrix urinaevulpis]|uniref:1-deoxy-D-xylulose-5-phosphate synthase N-terminal domain-containing protein n=1 Tax=Erysipelothrix urinaevulpis TaxID=2683717 RepID=UPI00135C8FC4|nr:1-deoxy-D-xylulose-5-phosphate synthase N-terminal domain-containing protein [Erysipelothrix urinaevulpis]
MDIQNIQSMTLEELEKLSDDIALYLAKESPYDVETVMQNINVLEMTVALHHLFDMDSNRVIFDQEEQSLVHQILLGKQIHYTGPSEAGWALGEALAQSLVYTEGKTFVIINDHALSKGSTYESLVEIAKENPSLVIIMMDEQHSLLRHYSSIDAIIKSVRISKAYTSLKSDMKSVLNNPVSKPLLDSLTWIRDQVKETVLEPSIFTQFNINYHGPIDGQNMNECVRVLKLSEKFIGPYVIHTQTRLRNKKRRKLEFPNYKLDQTIPAYYKTYIEALDEYFVTNHKEDDLFILSDGLSVSEHLIHYSQFRPRQYFAVNSSTSALVDMAYGFAKEGKKVVLLISAFRVSQVMDRLRHHFDRENYKVLLVVYEAGLARHDRLLHSAVYDLASYLQLSDTPIFMPSTIGAMKTIIDHHFNQDGFTVLRIAQTIDNHEDAKDEPHIWKETLEINEKTEGIIISFGPAIHSFKKKITTNNLNIALIDAQILNQVDEELLQKIIDADVPTLVYNIEGEFDLLSYTIRQYLLSIQSNFPLIEMNLSGLTFEGSSKDIKTKNHLHIEDAITIIERK